MKTKNLLDVLAQLSKEAPEDRVPVEEDMLFEDLIHLAVEPLGHLFAILWGEDGEMNRVSDIGRTLCRHAKDKIRDCFESVEKALGGAIRVDTRWTGHVYDYELLGSAYISPPEESPQKPEQAPAGKGEDIPDFRTVKPETNEEDQLQRTFEVMREGGWNRDFLEKAIAVAWESNIRGEGPFLDKVSAAYHKGLVIKKDEESEHAGGEASGA